MDHLRIIVTTVLTTLVVILFGTVATTTLWPDSAQAHGMAGTGGHGFRGMHGGASSDGRHCGRFGPRHTQLLEAFVSIQLGLDDDQEQALEPVIEAVDRWRSDTNETCESLSISTIPEGLDTLQQVLSRSEQAVAEISPLFTAFYATLDDEQRVDMDSWINHRGHNQE